MSSTAIFFSGSVARDHAAVPELEIVGPRRSRSLAAISRSCSLQSMAAARTAGDSVGTVLLPPTGGGELGGAGVGVLDLDPSTGHAQLLGDHHGHDRLGAGADVDCAHVEIDAAVGEVLDDGRRGRTTAAGDPGAGRHADAAAGCGRRSRLPVPWPPAQPKASAPSTRHSLEAGGGVGHAAPRLADTSGGSASRSSTGSMLELLGERRPSSARGPTIPGDGPGRASAAPRRR